MSKKLLRRHSLLHLPSASREGGTEEKSKVTKKPKKYRRTLSFLGLFTGSNSHNDASGSKEEEKEGTDIKQETSLTPAGTGVAEEIIVSPQPAVVRQQTDPPVERGREGEIIVQKDGVFTTVRLRKKKTVLSQDEHYEARDSFYSDSYVTLPRKGKRPLSKRISWHGQINETCHHSDCQDGNNYQPLNLCQECDETIHSEPDRSGHLRFEAFKRGTSVLSSYSSAPTPSLGYTPERGSRSDDEGVSESSSPKHSTEGIADSPEDDTDGEIKNWKLKRKAALKKKGFPSERRNKKPPIVPSHTRSQSLQESELHDALALRDLYSNIPLKGISENRTAHSLPTAAVKKRKMYSVHKSDSVPRMQKPRAMSVDVPNRPFQHLRSASLGSALYAAEYEDHGNSGDISGYNDGKFEDGTADVEEERAGDMVGGRPMEMFGPKRLYQSREREKRHTIDNSPVGRKMVGTKTKQGTDHTTIRQRKTSLAMEVFALKFDLKDPGGEETDTELVPAVKGRNLRDAITQEMDRRHINIDKIEIFLEASRTPLPLVVDCFHLGGNHLYVKAKDGESPFKTNTLQYHNSVSKSRAAKKESSLGSQNKKASKSLSEDAPYDNHSPHGTISKADTRQAPPRPGRHKISSIFNPFSGKNQEKLEALNDILNQYSVEGLPTMPDLVVMGQTQYDESLFITERHWTDFVDQQEVDTMTKKQKDQQEAFWELIHTEADYIKKIKVIIDVFKCCIINLQNESILNEIELDKAFGNISDIYLANCEFWEEHLYKVLKHSRETHQLLNPSLAKEGFLKFDVLFHSYTKYCLEQKAMLEYIKTKGRENELFKTFVNWAEALERCHRLQLHDLVVKPMQRLTKYKLLLKAVLKKTEQEEQRKDLIQMIEKVDKFVTEVNTVMHQKDEHERLSVIIDRLEAYDAIETPSEESKDLVADYCRIDLTCPVPGCGPHQRRNLLMEGSLKLKDAYTRMDVYCFLFTDMLLVTKPNRRSDKVKVIKPPMRLDKIIVHQLRDGTSFMLAYLNEYHLATAVYTFHGDTKTSTESRLWLEKIKQAQDAYQKMRNAAMDRSENRLMYLDIYEEGEDMDFAIFNAGTLPRPSSTYIDLSPDQILRQDSGSSADAFVPNMDMRRSQSFVDEALLAREALAPEQRASDNSRPRSVTIGEMGRSRSPRLHLTVPLQPDHHEHEKSSSPPDSPCDTLRHVQSAEVFTARPAGSRPRVPSIKCQTDPGHSLGHSELDAESPTSETIYIQVPANRPDLLNDENIIRKLNQRRKRPGEPRFNTADSIQELKKDPKDASIKKRLSWNNGTVYIDIGEGGRGGLKDAFSSDSLRSMPSSSGVSSTGSLHLSPESEICEEVEPDTPTPSPASEDYQMTYSLSDQTVCAPNYHGNTGKVTSRMAHPHISQSMRDESTSTDDTETLMAQNKSLSKSVPDFCELLNTKISISKGELRDGIASVEIPNNTDSPKKKMSHGQLMKMRKQLLLNSTIEASEV